MTINSVSPYTAPLPGARPQSRSASKIADADTTGNSAATTGMPDPAMERETAKLKARDQEVRAHEQAHLAAAGGIAMGGASFSYVTGPDGRRYATGGEVSIDTSAVPDDPQASIRKAETIRRAALAPANPSGQDFSVASKAAAMAAKSAMALLHAEQQDKTGDFKLDVNA